MDWSRPLVVLLALSLAAPATLAGPVDAKAQAQTRSQPGSSADFRLDPAQRTENFRKSAAIYAQTDAGLGQVAADLAKALEGADVIEPYMANYGMTSSNLMDVMAIAWFSAIMLADGGRTDDPTQAQIDGIRGAFATIQLDSIAALPNAEKQRLADTLLFSTLLQQSVAEGLAGQPVLQSWLEQFAVFNSELLGFDVASLSMGPNGIVGLPSPGDRAFSQDSSGGAQGDVSRVEAGGRLSNGKDSILGVTWKTQLLFMPGPGGGGLSNYEDMTVLFKDGRACDDCFGEALEGQLSAFARANPDDMGRWRKAGTGYIVSWPDGDTDELDADDVHGAAPPAARLSGEFKSVSGNSGIALSTNYIRFTPDGRFSTEGSTSISGEYVVGYVGRGARTGRYDIDGFRIRFAYDDGETVESSFLWWEQDKDFVIIDESAFYIPEDD